MRVTPPPMMTCEGLKKFTTEASILPIWVPANWMMRLAAASPLRLAWPTSSGEITPLASTQPRLPHQRPNPGQDHARPAAHVGGFAVLRQHGEVGQHQCQVQAGGAQVGAKDDPQAGIQLDGFGPAPARRALQPHLFQQAAIQKRCDGVVSLALGKAKPLRQGVARCTCGPKNGLQRHPFVR